MKSLITTIILITLTFNSQAQQKINYFKDIYLSKKTNKQRAKYQETLTLFNGNIIREVLSIKKEITILKELHTGEQIGIWHKRIGRKKEILNYDFPLEFTDKKCNDTAKIISENQILVDFENQMLTFLAENTLYPEIASDNGIGGLVTLLLDFDSKGNLLTPYVVSHPHISLAKESVRVINLFFKNNKFPTIYKRPFCHIYPVQFLSMEE